MLWANKNCIDFHTLSVSVRLSESLIYVLTSLKTIQKIGSFKYNLIEIADKKINMKQLNDIILWSIMTYSFLQEYNC